MKRRKSVESKILNFPDAMKIGKLLLASGVKVIDFSATGIGKILSSLHPTVYLEILKTFTGENSKSLSTLVGNDALSIFTTGLHVNRINTLLSYMESVEEP